METDGAAAVGLGMWVHPVVELCTWWSPFSWALELIIKLGIPDLPVTQVLQWLADQR